MGWIPFWAATIQATTLPSNIAKKKRKKDIPAQPEAPLMKRPEFVNAPVPNKKPAVMISSPDKDRPEPTATKPNKQQRHTSAPQRIEMH